MSCVLQLCFDRSPQTSYASTQQGKNLVHLIDRQDEPYCFRLHKDRVFYVSESSMRLGISVARPNLVSLGTCFGKFTKSGKFMLHISALDYLAKYAKYKVTTNSSFPVRCSRN
jgi:ribosome biogenesis protein Nip4